MNLPVYIVSLDKDSEKYEAACSSLKQSCIGPVRRIRGVPGGTLPDIACDLLTLTTQYHVGKGALGCFLAHASAWENIAAAEAEWSLIFEDDVQFLNLNRLCTAHLPGDADIVFCNEFMEPEEPFCPPDDGALQFVPIDASLRKMVAHGYTGIGTQGYFLSRSGAAKLITAILSDKFFGHVDWRLMRYSTSEAMIEASIPGSFVAEVLQNHHNVSHPPCWSILKAFATTPCLVKHNGAVSNRELEDARP